MTLYRPAVRPHRHFTARCTGPVDGWPLRRWREEAWAQRHPRLNAIAITALLALAFAFFGWCLVASRPDLIERLFP